MSLKYEPASDPLQVVFDETTMEAGHIN